MKKSQLTKVEPTPSHKRTKIHNKKKKKQLNEKRFLPLRSTGQVSESRACAHCFFLPFFFTCTYFFIYEHHTAMAPRALTRQNPTIQHNS